MAMTIASFATADIKNPSTEQAGKKIFTAFQHRAFMEYNTLVPTLTQLLQVMDANASFYGPYLTEAKAEISKVYDADVKGIENSFVVAIEQGNANHINWSKAEFVSAERENDNLIIEFTVDGKSHKMEIAITDINGDLRAGKIIALI